MNQAERLGCAGFDARHSLTVLVRALQPMRTTMNLHRRHKANRRVTATKARTNRPTVILANVFRVDSGMKVVRVLLAEQNKAGRKQLARFCHANGLYARTDKDNPGWMDVTGSEEDLLRLDSTRFWANPLITEWHWMSNAHVCNGSGAGQNPKRKPETTTIRVRENKVRVAIPRMAPTSIDGMKEMREWAEKELSHR